MPKQCVPGASRFFARAGDEAIFKQVKVSTILASVESTGFGYMLVLVRCLGVE